MLRKTPIIAFLFSVVPIATYAHSHTFFRPRSITTDSIYELALAQYDRYHTAEDMTVNFYARPLYLKSTNKNNLARYFLPCNKACITLDETGDGDVDPLWFNLIAPAGSFYQSTVCLCPTRTVWGATLSMYLNYCNWWFGVHTTAMQATHKLNLTESNRTADGTLDGFKNACDGFNNPTWTAGRLSCCALKKSGFDDVQFKLGYDFCKNEDNHASVYLVATAPTGKQPTACYLFEPLVGSNHASAGVGFNGEYRFSTCDERAWSVMADIKYRYIFKACERRSFDVCANGDWSRYLLVVTQDEPLDSMPGINLFTLHTTVTPGSTIDAWLALHYERCNWQFEVGYDFWWQQAEKLCNKCPIASGFGIQTLALCNQPITSASTATISQTASGNNITQTDATFTELTTNLLNAQSGAQPSALSNTLYLDVGYSKVCNRAALLFGLGASYEFANKHALSQWGIWYTQGVSF